MRFGKKGSPLFTAFKAGSVVYSESSAWRAKSEARPVREKQYTLTPEFIDSYPDQGYWRDMLSGDFDYVIEARVENPADLDPTRPDDGTRLLIVRGAPKE